MTTQDTGKLSVDDLVYHGLDLCDACGGPLPVEDRLAGICAPCLARFPAPLEADLRPRSRLPQESSSRTT